LGATSGLGSAVTRTLTRLSLFGGACSPNRAASALLPPVNGSLIRLERNHDEIVQLPLSCGTNTVTVDVDVPPSLFVAVIVIA